METIMGARVETNNKLEWNELWRIAEIVPSLVDIFLSVLPFLTTKHASTPDIFTINQVSYLVYDPFVFRTGGKGFAADPRVSALQSKSLLSVLFRKNKESLEK